MNTRYGARVDNGFTKNNCFIGNVHTVLLQHDRKSTSASIVEADVLYETDFTEVISFTLLLFRTML